MIDLAKALEEVEFEDVSRPFSEKKPLYRHLCSGSTGSVEALVPGPTGWHGTYSTQTLMETSPARVGFLFCTPSELRLAPSDRRSVGRVNTEVSNPTDLRSYRLVLFDCSGGWLIIPAPVPEGNQPLLLFLCLPKEKEQKKRHDHQTHWGVFGVQTDIFSQCAR